MRWLTEDPTGEDGGVNLYGMCQNNLITLCDMLGLFSVYVHEEGAVGHVGILASNGFSYDYGRYYGTYSGLGLAFSGPNVLMTNKWDDVSSSHKYTTFRLNVCKALDDAIVKVANRRFDNGLAKWPEDRRYAKFQKITPNERYMGSDWSWNADNCITFTFRTIVSGVKEARDSGKLSGKAAKQAQTLLWLSFDACFQPRPKEVKSLLERYSRAYDWISVSK